MSVVSPLPITARCIPAASRLPPSRRSLRVEQDPVVLRDDLALGETPDRPSAECVLAGTPLRRASSSRAVVTTERLGQLEALAIVPESPTDRLPAPMVSTRRTAWGAEPRRARSDRPPRSSRTMPRGSGGVRDRGPPTRSWEGDHQHAVDAGTLRLRNRRPWSPWMTAMPARRRAGADEARAPHDRGPRTRRRTAHQISLAITVRSAPPTS